MTTPIPDSTNLIPPAESKSKTVNVNREWIGRLIELGMTDLTQEVNRQFLEGYISSAESFLG